MGGGGCESTGGGGGALIERSKEAFPYLVKDVQVSIDASHCDGEACLVNIETSQLPSSEEFHYQYQVREQYDEVSLPFS